MKRLIAAIALTALATTLSAAPAIDIAALKKYAAKALPKCPDEKLDIQMLDQAGPTNFLMYGVTQTSSDKNCGGQKYLLYSPRTQQILLGTVVPLPEDGRPAEVRLSEKATDMLKEPLTAKVAAFPLPDGVKSVAIYKQSEYGPFAFHGYLDASERFLVVGTRGNLTVDPGKSLLESLGMDAAVRRGNPKSKVQIVELSDFQCPTCGRAHKTVEPIIAKNLSKVDYYRLDLPLFEHHEWAMYAALGARAIQKVAPAKYWQYVDFIFGNQETIGKGKFDEVLKNFCEDHDIDWTKVEKIYHSPAQKQALLEQVSRAFDNGVVSTPTYIVNGQVLGFGPEGKFTVQTIKDAVSGK